MGTHVIDNEMIQNNFSTQEMRDIWAGKNRLEQQLRVESALARSEAELGIIPESAARKITAMAHAANMDMQQLAYQAGIVKHSLTPTVQALRNLVGADGEFVHFGVTTQDIVDTGMVLQLKQSYAVIRRDTIKLLHELLRLAKKYQYTVMAGRTHGMQALPITFGFKIAVWADEVERHIQRFDEAEQRVFFGNISGAVGTYAAFGDIGPEIESRTLSRLGLGTPTIAFQSARDRFSEYANIAALLSGTLGKIGNELYNLMRSEIDEIEEPFTTGKIGSTTMPHKRNPAMLEGLAGLTKLVFKSTALIHESLIVEHERDAMSWRAEWVALPEVNLYLAAQLQGALAILAGLTVKQDNMRSNLYKQEGLILSEKVMFEVGKRLGKETAHEIVYRCAMKATTQRLSFIDCLSADKAIKKNFSRREVGSWLTPEEYIGLAPEKVDLIIDTIGRKRG